MSVQLTDDPREVVYDEQINPLVAQIIFLCREHNIPHFMTFQVSNATDEDAELLIHTTRYHQGDSEKIARLIDLATEKPVTFGLTIYKTPPAP